MSDTAPSPDLIIQGRVFLGLAAGFADALAIDGGRVVAVGAVDDVAGLLGPETRRIDLGGRVAIPGLNEAHTHHLPFGLGLSQVNLRAADGVRSLDVGRHPLAAEIDRAVPDHPVMIVRTCGHMSVANTAAIRLAGVGHTCPIQRAAPSSGATAS